MSPSVNIGVIMHIRYFSLLCLSLLLKIFFIYSVIHFSGIGLGPDEAQYWTWSQFLDWGYYSKPPGIAWEIGLGTQLFGNTEFGVRFVAIMIGSAIPLIVYLLAKNCHLSPKTCFWAGMCMAFTPLGFLASLLAITDGGMVLAWTAACAYLVEKVMNKHTPNYLLLGLLMAVGALFKWPIYLFWVVVLASWTFFSYLISRKIIYGIVISLLGLLPSLYWNAKNGWPTFKHVAATIAGGHSQAKAGAIVAGNMLEFFGAQAALLFPILFVMLFLSLWSLYRTRNANAGVWLCGGITLVLLLGGILCSIFMKIQGNWIIFAYPSSFIPIAWYAVEQGRQRKGWLIASLILSTMAMAFVFAIPSIQSQGAFSSIQIPYKINPFRHNVGWHHLAKALQQKGYRPGQDFLFGDKYQMASILSFYGPDQHRAYFFNLQRTRQNQFSFWPKASDSFIGKRGFFVVVENTPQLNNAEEIAAKYSMQLKQYFEEVKYLGITPLFSAYGKVEKGALIFECIGFNGQQPADPELY